jgi:hypothetical protein
MQRTITLSLCFALLISVLSGVVWDKSVQADSPEKQDIRNIGQPLVQPLTAAQLANDRRFRETFGLRADDAYIRDLYQKVARGALPGADRTWAALLTAAEATDMTRRQQLIESVGPNPYLTPNGLTPFGAALRSRISEFGGEYFDQQADGAVVVLVTSDVAGVARTLAPVLGPLADHLRVVQVAHNYAELASLSARIASDFSWLKQQGIPVSSFGPDVRENAVVVRTSAPTGPVAAALAARYPAAPIRVVSGPTLRALGSSDTQAPPMMGGLLMWKCADGAVACSAAQTCSSGFITRTVTSGGETPTYGVLSAGHCGGGTWLQGSPYTVGDYTVGSTSTFVFDASGDVEVIPLSVQQDGTHSPFVYISTTSCGFLCTSHNLRVISGFEATTNVGEITCESRSNSDEQDEICGSVTQSEQCVIEAPSNTFVCHQMFSNFPSNFGDSGGPFYQPQVSGTSVAQGITSSSDVRTLTTYTQIADALAAISNAGGGSWTIN